MTRTAPGGIGLFPDGWVRHFRRQCRRPFPLNYVLAPKLPKGTRIVIFPGGLEPGHAIEGRYGDHYPATTALRHLQGLFAPDRPERPWRYLRRYIRPAPWVAEHWRD